MERNEPRWFLNLCFTAPQPSVERQRVKALNLPWETTILCQPSTKIHMVNWFISVKNGFFSPNIKRAIVVCPDESKNILTSSRANTSKIPPTHNSLCPSTTSHSELKLYVFPHSIRCQSILAGVPMSPTTDRPAQKKSPPEREPICVLIHSAGLDMSKQAAFTAVATLFSSNCQAIGLSTHSLNQGWWQQTKHPQPWIEGNKHFSRNT